MIVPPKIKMLFDFNEPYIKYVGNKVRETLLSYCEKNSFAFVYRYKSIESLAEKIESGRFERWQDIEDLFACAVIIPNLTYEDSVILFLDSIFSRVQLKKRGSSLKAPEIFNFDSTRYIGNLKPREGDIGNPLINNISFEVQIRTAFEHAWIVTTHSLVYKNELVDWKRKRLASQLKAVVEQMDMIAVNFDQTSQIVQENQWPEVWVKKDIIDLFNRAINQGLIRKELIPKDWTRFTDNIYNLIISTREVNNMSPLKKARYAQRCLKTLNSELERIDSQKMPLSISLTQLIFGILTKCNILKPPLRGFYPIITDELITLYPSVAVFNQKFEF